VDYPEIKNIEELTEELETEFSENEDKNWMKFTDKFSNFFYILQESKNLIAEEIENEEGLEE